MMGKHGVVSLFLCVHAAGIRHDVMKALMDDPLTGLGISKSVVLSCTDEY